GGSKDGGSKDGGSKGGGSKDGGSKGSGSKGSGKGGGSKGSGKGGGSDQGAGDATPGVVTLEIHFSLQDTDGSETLASGLVLTDIPDGATLSVGVPGADPGTWVIAQDDLTATAFNEDGQPISWTVDDLTITPPEGSAEDFTLGIQVTTQDGDDFNTASGSVIVEIPDVEAPEAPPVIDYRDIHGTHDYTEAKVSYDKTFTGDGDKSDNDHITGTSKNDLIDGKDGNDHLEGGAGNDKLIGGAGNDQLDGGTGNDILDGGTGNDKLTGGDGNDVLSGGAGNDNLDAGQGNDLFLFGSGGGHDQADGGAGGSWLDTVNLQDVTGGFSQSLEHSGDWTLQTDAEYTVGTDGSITFTEGDASGTITLYDGSVLEFTNMEKIEW
ncbi:MAG: hypothetical protein HQM03_14450, partial [Magnetococcales bacterium]|nr:hypothetical protein [Magnetococcales bacterium]